MADNEKSFEDLMKELDEVIVKLDDKEIKLEDAVKCYTKGVELSKKCYDILNKNEELVVKEMTKEGLVDFDSDQ